MAAHRWQGLFYRLSGGLVRKLMRSPLERERDFYRRYRELSDGINEAPDLMTNYVLRGELSLARGEYERAKVDFQAALALAEDLDETKGWLVLEQVLRDRALYGLKVAERHLGQTGPRINVEA